MDRADAKSTLSLSDLSDDALLIIFDSLRVHELLKMEHMHSRVKANIAYVLKQRSR